MLQTVEPNLSHLPELLRMSKSLVFVPDRATAKIVRKACHALGLPHWVSGESDFAQVINFERDKENFATVCVLPCGVTGWHSLAEQIIWIGPIPDAGDKNQVVTFGQAMERVPRCHASAILANWGTP